MRKHLIKRFLAIMIASMMTNIIAIDSGSGIWSKTPIKAWANTEYCDVNEDGSVTTSDLISLAKMIIGTEATNSVADIDCDGKVDSIDFIKLRNVFLNGSEPNTTQDNPQNNEEDNSIYCFYYSMIKMLARTFGDILPNNPTYYNYYLYDINGDGIYELITHVGGGEADAILFIYTIDTSSNEVKEISHFSVTHSWLSTQDDKLYINTGHQGYYFLTLLEMDGDSDSWSISQNLIREESDLLDYTTYGTALKGYRLSDTSAIEELCPRELLDDVPNVEGYAKTIYDESRLYLSGHFNTVSIVTYSNVDDYKYDTEYYSVDDIGEYITLPYNGYPAAYVIVTPFNEAGVVGEPIKCYVENSTLLNLDGTNPNHKGTVFTDGDVLFIRSSPEIINSPDNGNKIDCFNNGTIIDINLNYSTDEWYFVTGTGVSGNTVSGYVFREYVRLN
ncbi:dockerin type I repeat-containing protein [Ruminococcus sp. HUN007]|uniref:dockerin type I repeat-containing protein n=1 Tax=Ruminococcus sp. HUN007 TaxID=1514668 RepID=UPI0005D165FC|nr:dockerin type I repeat-containing protein [Ruminococcus sp. HUN007]